MSQWGDQRDWLMELASMSPLTEREKEIARGAMDWKCAEIDPDGFGDYPQIVRVLKEIGG